MDFKSLMSAQIAKAKPSVGAKSKPEVHLSKYQRRSEIETARETAYAAEQTRLETEREERAAKRRRVEEEEAGQNAVREEKRRKLAAESKARREIEEQEQERARRKRLGLPELPADKSAAVGAAEDDSHNTTPLPDDQPDIAEDELRSKLRELKQPVVLYDESHIARLKRFYTLSSKGKKQLSKGPIPTMMEPVPEKDMLLPSLPTGVPPKPSAEYDFLHRQIASYLTLLLTEWSHSLASRPREVQTSQSGRQAAQIYTSVLSDLSPLFRKLEAQSLSAELLKALVQILREIQRRRYVSANDLYLTVSIGKAAWPIGVTMVGIHERSARQKLHETEKGKGKDEIAHILADETTRKILQSIKRCLSFAQTRWPPDDSGQLFG